MYVYVCIWMCVCIKVSTHSEMQFKVPVRFQDGVTCSVIPKDKDMIKHEMWLLSAFD